MRGWLIAVAAAGGCVDAAPGPTPRHDFQQDDAVGVADFFNSQLFPMAPEATTAGQACGASSDPADGSWSLANGVFTFDGCTLDGLTFDAPGTITVQGAAIQGTFTWFYEDNSAVSCDLSLTIDAVFGPCFFDGDNCEQGWTARGKICNQTVLESCSLELFTGCNGDSWFPQIF